MSSDTGHTTVGHGTRVPAIVVVLLFSWFFASPADGVLTPSPPSALAEGQYFQYRIRSEWTLPNATVREDFLKVVVVSIGPIVVLSEVFYNEQDRISQIISYDAVTRQRLDNSTMSSWLWVTGADVADGVARIDAADAVLEPAAMHGQWILTDSGPGGHRTYHYSRSTGILQGAEGHFVGPGYDVRAIVTLVGSGVGGETIERSGSSPAQGPTPAPSYAFIHRAWQPPWVASAMWTETYGYGIHSRHAETTVLNRYSGRMSVHAGAYAGMGFGGARAQAKAVMQFPQAPSPKFSVGLSRNWLVTSYFEIEDGWTSGGFTCLGVFGCAWDNAWIWIKMEVYEASTGTSIGLKEVVVWDAPPLPSWAWWWRGSLVEVSRWYYLHGDAEYYGMAWIHVKSIATAVGISFSYAHTHPFQVRLYQVLVGY